ncbi:hypothetical protein BDA99DRAFT_502313 [Phascolomyces articulosus]|uniref:Uncharacterized protein n=1 Tax=Phascolomyces articulosus TaxID=60185 RepID=A0AAD5K5R9_9FUNG|nr:hypothetical protein BDA99DRAFT_502313 [Phascolomyces articulosus]
MVSKYILLLLVFYITITLSHSAIIPGYGDHGESNSDDLISDAAAFLNEDVLNSSNEDTPSSLQEDTIIIHQQNADMTTLSILPIENDDGDDEEDDDDEFQHVHSNENEKDIVYENIHYKLNEQGQFVIVPDGEQMAPIVAMKTASSEEEAIQLFEAYITSSSSHDDELPDEEEFSDEQDDISILNSHTMDGTGDHVRSHENGEDDEEGDEISDQVEKVLFDNDDSQQVTIDPETGMPVFANKNSDDFDFYRQIPESGQENENAMVGAAHDEDDTPVTLVDQSKPAMVIHHRPHSDRIDPGKFYHHTPSRYQPPSPKKSISLWERLWKYFVFIFVVVFVLVRRCSGAAQMSSSEAIATHQDWRKQLNYKYDQAAARLPVYYTQDMNQEQQQFTNYVDEKVETAEYNQQSRRASAGHIRKPSIGRSSQNGRLHHQRHTSLSSINTAALYRYSNGNNNSSP